MSQSETWRPGGLKIWKWRGYFATNPRRNYKWETGRYFTDAELTAMDAAVEKIKEESAAKDAEIERLKDALRGEETQACGCPCCERTDAWKEKADAAEQRILELEDEVRKYREEE